MAEHIELTLWRKKQVTLLYHFSSIEYLRSLSKMIDDLLMCTDRALGDAQRERRDDLLVDDRWGNRDTADNWGSHGWPFLLDFKRSIATDIAERGNQVFSVSGTNQFVRGTTELSLNWTTPEEEKRIEDKIRKISHHAMYMDETLRRDSREARWDDFGLAAAWTEFGKAFPRLPKLKLHYDIVGMTGLVPEVTGVFIPQDDQHGSPQFAWRGESGGKLLESTTFDSVGLAALKAVGRRDLWVNDSKMYSFASSPKHRDRFIDDMSIADTVHPGLASSSVAQHAFRSRSCKWYFVELIPGEFEDYDDGSIPTALDERVRVFGGDRCPRAGYYFTPAKIDSRRYFEQGEVMPDFPNGWGTVIWQSDD